MSPTERTLKLLRKQGYLAAVVEKWNKFARCRQDLFGIGDILAVHEWKPIRLIQVTDMAHNAEHVKKLMSLDNTRIVQASMSIEVWAWRKLKSGWEPRVTEITVKQLEGVRR